MNIINYDFRNESSLRIPQEVYRPYQRCEFCESVYLTDNLCESCGRSVRYDLIGTPFGYKSFYGLKERYIQNLPLLVRYYPIFEDIQSQSAKSLVRHLQKRLADLSAMPDRDDKKLFELEAFEIINELLFYAVSFEAIRSCLAHNLEFERHLVEASQNIAPKKSWMEDILSYRLSGTLRVKFVLVTITLTVFFLASIVFSLRYGR